MRNGAFLFGVFLDMEGTGECGTNNTKKILSLPFGFIVQGTKVMSSYKTILFVGFLLFFPSMGFAEELKMFPSTVSYVNLQASKEEMVVDGDFSILSPDDTAFWKQWNLQKDAKTDADIDLIEEEEPSENRFLRVSVRKNGKFSWQPLLLLRNLHIREDVVYTVSFRVRSNIPCQLTVNAMQNRPPWQNLGFRKTFNVDKEWNTVSFSFTAKQSDTQGRLSIYNFPVGVIDLDDFSIREGIRATKDTSFSKIILSERSLFRLF